MEKDEIEKHSYFLKSLKSDFIQSTWVAIAISLGQKHQAFTDCGQRCCSNFSIRCFTVENRLHSQGMLSLTLRSRTIYWVPSARECPTRGLWAAYDPGWL